MVLPEVNLALDSNLNHAKASGVRFVILGIGEDIGPRANLGRGGATDAFDSAMAQFLNLQSNRFLSGNECLVLGQIKTEDLALPENSETTQLRNHVDQLDERVIQVISSI